MQRVLPVACKLTAHALELTVKIAKADATQAAVAAVACGFFAALAVHSTMQFFDWPFSGSCSFLEIPKYMVQATLFGCAAGKSAKIACSKAQTAWNVALNQT